MTAQDLFRCIGNLSDTMIEEAADIRRKKRWLPIAALAACAVLAISIPLAVRNLGYKNADNASQAAGAETPTTESPASDEKPAEDGMDKVAAMIATYKKLQLDCLVILGGNGTQKTANLLREEGLNVVGLPKTIDNDIWGTDMTFGFQSAVDIAAAAIDNIHTTASSHGRVFIVEVMGHKVGWLTLHAGIAGGADVILLPEIPYDVDAVVEAIQKRSQMGKRFSILAVAEGAISREDAMLSKKEYKAVLKKSPYPSISYQLGAQIQERTGQEVRITVPGHTQRGGAPCPYDRVIASRLGAAAAELILKEKYGYMVGFKNDDIVPVPLEEVAGRLKMVDPEASIIKEAKDMGISFGTKE